MRVFPHVWDWYLQWREQRRGCYTKWEIDMLAIGLALVRNETGWLRQTPRLAEHLKPIPGLINERAPSASTARSPRKSSGACLTRGAIRKRQRKPGVRS